MYPNVRYSHAGKAVFAGFECLQTLVTGCFGPQQALATASPFRGTQSLLGAYFGIVDKVHASAHNLQATSRYCPRVSCLHSAAAGVLLFAACGCSTHAQVQHHHLLLHVKLLLVPHVPAMACMCGLDAYVICLPTAVMPAACVPAASVADVNSKYKRRLHMPCVNKRLVLKATSVFCLVTRGSVTLLAGHTHQPAWYGESDCGGLQQCCH
jgi:hypothetical protein